MCPLGPQDTFDSLQHKEGDAQSTTYAKKLKRGVKRLCEPTTSQALLTMVTITEDQSHQTQTTAASFVYCVRAPLVSSFLPLFL